MISGEEIKVIDQNSEYYKMPTNQLMENAGKGLTDFIKKQFIHTKKILFICGVGNNGGDGFVAARYLSETHHVTLFLTGEKKDIKTKISQENFKKLEKTKTTIYTIKNIEKLDELVSENNLIVDSILGIGLTGELRKPCSFIVDKINKSNKKIVSVDIPTGFGTNKSVKPDYTVTFHDVKNGMNQKNCGIIKIVDIGVPEKAETFVGSGDLSVYYPIPKKNSHKGENGRVLIIGGGPYIGAPALSGLAALRTGADLVYICTPKKSAKAITSFSPEILEDKKTASYIAKKTANLIVQELSNYDKLTTKDVGIILPFFPKCNCIIIGPGLGTDNETQKTIKTLIAYCVKDKKRMVIDADAITVAGQNYELIKNSETIVTPHSSEFEKLTGIKLTNNLDERKKTVKKWAKKLGITILLKGPTDIISNGDEIKLNDTHNPAMTVGGTGDVLSGITGAFLSKKLDPFIAARIAAFLNGYSGNQAFKKYSYGLLATDIIEEIPNVLKKYIGTKLLKHTME